MEKVSADPPSAAKGTLNVSAHFGLEKNAQIGPLGKFFRTILSRGCKRTNTKVGDWCRMACPWATSATTMRTQLGGRPRGVSP